MSGDEQRDEIRNELRIVTPQIVVEITRRVEFDAGHRIALHGGKCKHVHGHRYVMEACVGGSTQSEGEEAGMVMDFAVLKQHLDKIVNVVDHSLMLWAQDPILMHRVWSITRRNGFCTMAHVDHIGMVCVFDFHPTAEELARCFANFLHNEMKRPVGVTLWETPNCKANCVVE